MRIEVTKTMPCAVDGVHTQLYRAGETYELPDHIGAIFVREQWGREAKSETKKAKGPAENK